MKFQNLLGDEIIYLNGKYIYKKGDSFIIHSNGKDHRNDTAEITYLKV